MRIRRLLAVAVLLVLLMLWTTVPAQAGGPTSVLLSSPSAGKVVATGYGDGQYRELERLLDPNAGREPVDSTIHEVGHFVRATWLIHDMSVWRVDIIYPDAPGGPWIATSLYGPRAPGTGDAKPTWHRATDPAALIKLLSGLNLIRGERNGEQLGSGPTAPPQAASAESGSKIGETFPTASTEKEEPGFFTGWRWILPGLLLGAALAVAAHRFLPRRHWELTEPG